MTYINPLNPNKTSSYTEKSKSPKSVPRSHIPAIDHEHEQEDIDLLNHVYDFSGKKIASMKELRDLLRSRLFPFLESKQMVHSAHQFDSILEMLPDAIAQGKFAMQGYLTYCKNLALRTAKARVNQLRRQLSSSRHSLTEMSDSELDLEIKKIEAYIEKMEPDEGIYDLLVDISLEVPGVTDEVNNIVKHVISLGTHAHFGLAMFTGAVWPVLIGKTYRDWGKADKQVAFLDEQEKQIRSPSVKVEGVIEVEGKQDPQKLLVNRGGTEPIETKPNEKESLHKRESEKNKSQNVKGVLLTALTKKDNFDEFNGILRKKGIDIVKIFNQQEVNPELKKALNFLLLYQGLAMYKKTTDQSRGFFVYQYFQNKLKKEKIDSVKQELTTLFAFHPQLASMIDNLTKEEFKQLLGHSFKDPKQYAEFQNLQLVEFATNITPALKDSAIQNEMALQYTVNQKALAFSTRNAIQAVEQFKFSYEGKFAQWNKQAAKAQFWLTVVSFFGAGLPAFLIALKVISIPAVLLMVVPVLGSLIGSALVAYGILYVLKKYKPETFAKLTNVPLQLRLKWSKWKYDRQKGKITALWTSYYKKMHEFDQLHRDYDALVKFQEKGQVSEGQLHGLSPNIRRKLSRDNFNEQKLLEEKRKLEAKMLKVSKLSPVALINERMKTYEAAKQQYKELAEDMTYSQWNDFQSAARINTALEKQADGKNEEKTVDAAEIIVEGLLEQDNIHNLENEQTKEILNLLRPLGINFPAIINAAHDAQKRLPRLLKL